MLDINNLREGGFILLTISEVLIYQRGCGEALISWWTGIREKI
jgi:hypothetical protein